MDYNMNFIKQYHKKLTREMLEESIFIIDTNCLLSPLKDYVIGDKILEAFEKITNSTYIPFITQVEYLENELSVINNRKRNVGEVKKIHRKLEDETSILTTDIRSIIHNRLFNEFENTDDMRSIKDEFSQFEELYINEVEALVGDTLEDLDNKLLEKKKNLYDRFSWTDLLTDVDNIKYRLDNWLDRVNRGEAYTNEQVENFSRLIKERYQLKMSPGYQDAEEKSSDFIFFSGVGIPRSYSDAVFWLDSLEYLADNTEKIATKKYLVILSNERKADWVVGKESSRLNIDMYGECSKRTGLIAKKIDIWSFVELLGYSDETTLNQSKEMFQEEGYNFSLYGVNHEAMTQREMMEQFFQSILSRVNGQEFLDLPITRGAS